MWSWTAYIIMICVCFIESGTSSKRAISVWAIAPSVTSGAWPVCPARVDVVARVHQAATVIFARPTLGQKRRVVCLEEKHESLQAFNQRTVRALPDQITVRIIRFTATIRGFRSHRITLVTTLLDRCVTRPARSSPLYARRWRLELTLRDLKTTMAWNNFAGQTPAMARKELLAYLVAPQPDPLCDGSRPWRAMKWIWNG